MSLTVASFRSRLKLIPFSLLPATGFLVVLLAIPIGLLFVFSLLSIERGIITSELTLKAYIDIFTDPFYLYIFVRTFAIACAVTFLCLIFGYPVAYLFIKASPVWRNVILVCVAAPLLTSALVRTFGWIVILGGQGAVNSTLLELGWINRPIKFLFAWQGVLLGMTQVMLPFMIVPLISTLQSLPTDLEEAASNLGASRMQIFWNVTVPQSIPGIAAGSSLVFVLAYSEFTVPVLMGGASFNVVSVYIFQSMTTLIDWAQGAALSSLLLITSLAAIVCFNFIFRKLAPWNSLH